MGDALKWGVGDFPAEGWTIPPPLHPLEIGSFPLYDELLLLYHITLHYI